MGPNERVKIIEKCIVGRRIEMEEPRQGGASASPVKDGTRLGSY